MASSFPSFLFVEVWSHQPVSVGFPSVVKVYQQRFTSVSPRANWTHGCLENTYTVMLLMHDKYLKCSRKVRLYTSMYYLCLQE